MGALTPPRSALIDTAINLSRVFCGAHTIDGVPALAHALTVARKIEQYLPAPGADLIAAALLHDAPYFAAPEVELDRMLDQLISPAVTRIVRGMAREDFAASLGAAEVAAIDISDPDALVVIAADTIVNVTVVIRRARRATDGAAYWGRRRAFIKRVPYFRAFAAAAEPHLPVGLARELATVVDHVYEATTPYRWPLPRQQGAGSS